MNFQQADEAAALPAYSTVTWASARGLREPKYGDIPGLLALLFRPRTVSPVILRHAC